MSNEIVNILRQHKALLFSKYPLQSMAFFGSYGRGDATDNSDVDILVAINGTMEFKFLCLNYEIKDSLQKKWI